MSPLLRLTRRLIAADPRAFRRGLALSVTVLAMGAALLGLSGWFVTAAAAAGLAGIGIGFDFFRPSAGVRFLALGRAAARYGERLVTHDAVLRALAALRVQLLAGIAALPHAAQARLRGARALNRLTADVDALDGLMLRLVLPGLAAVLTQLGAGVALWHLVAPAVALTVGAIYALGGGVILAQAARAGREPAEAAETALQEMRAASFDLVRSRADLAVAGTLPDWADRVGAEARAEAAARARLDAIEGWSSAAVGLCAAAAAAAALAIGGALASAGTLSAARAAIGVFVALALAETLGQLRRGMAEIGRMQGAGARVLALAPDPGPGRPRRVTDVDADHRADRTAPRASSLASPPASPAGSPPASPPASLPVSPPASSPAVPGAPVRPAATTPASDPAPGLGRDPLLQVRGLCLHRPGAAAALFGPLDLTLAPGETLMITGASGAGKSTLLATLAGLVAPSAGTITLAGRALCDWDEAALRAVLTLVPQRPQLIGGTLGENLALASAPGAALDAEAARAALEAVDLWDTLAPRGGLALSLGEGGAGLSGGQAKRAALARAALRRPRVLLLDEPTEGLDPGTAARTLAGLRRLLPDSGIVLVSHRAEDPGPGTRHLHLGPPPARARPEADCPTSGVLPRFDPGCDQTPL